jgi:hypothetical protein
LQALNTGDDEVEMSERITGDGSPVRVSRNENNPALIISRDRASSVLSNLWTSPIALKNVPQRPADRKDDYDQAVKGMLAMSNDPLLQEIYPVFLYRCVRSHSTENR